MTIVVIPTSQIKKVRQIKNLAQRIQVCLAPEYAFFTTVLYSPIYSELGLDLSEASAYQYL
jgi:hypothetical protein